MWLQRWLFVRTVSKRISFPDHHYFLPFRFLVLYTVYSNGLAVLYLSHSKYGGATPGRARSNDLAGMSKHAVQRVCIRRCSSTARARSNDLAGRSTALAHALAPGYHIWPLYLFYFDGETGVLRATTKKFVNFFWGKKCIRVTWLEDFLTSKWPGSFTALVPPMLNNSNVM